VTVTVNTARASQQALAATRGRKGVTAAAGPARWCWQAAQAQVRAEVAAVTRALPPGAVAGAASWLAAGRVSAADQNGGVAWHP